MLSLASPIPARRRLTQPPTDSAAAAGLRYVSDTGPGFTRRRKGRSFVFYDTGGKRINDPDDIKRINSLVIPPAWESVWICPRSNGHLQATGRDAKGRKQYRYHPRWREVRDESKYGRLIAFGESLPIIRSHINSDMSLPGMQREKVLATVVQLLEKALIRVGNDCYARENGSFGLTTLRNRHVTVAGSTIRFVFRGKSGKNHSVNVQDRRLARIVKRCQDIPGQELFQYEDETGGYQSVDSSDVNVYLRAITNTDFTAKDFRTWSGTVAATLALREVGPADSDTQAKKKIAAVVTSVADILGNTPAVCRKCYIHPDVVEAYLDGSLEKTMSRRTHGKQAARDLSSDESRVLALLKYRSGRRSRHKKAA